MTKFKILFITLSNIGDALLTTPTMEYLHKKYPLAKFDVVVDKKSEVVFKNCPYVESLIIKNKEEGLLGNLRLIKRLREKNYDVAVDLRTDLLLYFIKADKKLFKSKSNTAHSVEKHFYSLNKNVKKIPDMKIWLNEENRSFARNYFHKKSSKILSIGLGAHHDFKVWPSINYAQLAKRLSTDFDYIVLLGDKKDEKYSKIFIQNFNDNVINLCGKVNLLEAAYMIKISKLYIGNDSGLGHVAAAVGTSNFIIFGQGDVLRYRPWGRNSFFYQNEEREIKIIKVETILEQLKIINISN